MCRITLVRGYVVRDQHRSIVISVPFQRSKLMRRLTTGSSYRVGFDCVAGYGGEARNLARMGSNELIPCSKEFTYL